MGLRTELRKLTKDFDAVAQRSGSDGPRLKDLRPYWGDPTGVEQFAKEILDLNLWEGQRQMAQSVVENRLSALVTGASVGKTTLLAVLALFVAYCGPPGSQVLMTSSRQANLREQLARNVRRLWSRGRLPGDISATTVRYRDRSIVGLPASRLEAMVGFHALTLDEDEDVAPFALLCDESQASTDLNLADAGTQVATNLNDKVVLAGNASVDRQGWWAQTCLSNPQWATVQISALDHPNLMVMPGERLPFPGMVTEEGVKAIKAQGATPYAVRVLAEFPSDAAVDRLLKDGWIERAFAQHRELEKYEAMGLDGPVPWMNQRLYFSLDVGRKEDASVLTRRQGGAVHDIIPYPATGDVMDHVSSVIRQMTRWGQEPSRKDTRLAVDAAGIGGAVADVLRERTNWRVTDLNVGRAPTPGMKQTVKTDIPRIRDGLFWALRLKLEDGELALPESDRLREELAAITFEVDDSGRVVIATKRQLRSVLSGTSTDLVDSLCLSLAEQTIQTVSGRAVGHERQLF